MIYVDRSDVHEGRWEELKDGITALVAFVDRHQPQMATYASGATPGGGRA